MKDTSEIMDLLLSNKELTARIAESDHLTLGTMRVVLRIQERMGHVERQVNDIRSYIAYEDPCNVFPHWLAAEVTATTALLVGALNDWSLPIEIRDPAARMLQRVLFGAEHAPEQWWSTMTGSDMVYAIGYTHAEVPLAVAPAVLMRTRPGVHWLRNNKDLYLTDRSFFNYVQGSREWQARARLHQSN